MLSEDTKFSLRDTFDWFRQIKGQERLSALSASRLIGEIIQSPLGAMAPDLVEDLQENRAEAEQYLASLLAETENTVQDETPRKDAPKPMQAVLTIRDSKTGETAMTEGVTAGPVAKLDAESAREFFLLVTEGEGRCDSALGMVFGLELPCSCGAKKHRIEILRLEIEGELVCENGEFVFQEGTRN